MSYRVPYYYSKLECLTTETTAPQASRAAAVSKIPGESVCNLLIHSRTSCKQLMASGTPRDVERAKATVGYPAAIALKHRKTTEWHLYVH